LSPVIPRCCPPLKKGGGQRYFSHVVRNLGYREKPRQFAAAFGAYAERVEKPEEIRTAIKMAFAHMEKTKKPAILDIIVERETDCSMGASIDVIQEFEEEREAQEKQR
jgi:glyoxylate carboligase